MNINKRNIFIYWIGKDFKLISILRKIMYLHSSSGNGYNINFINDKNINNYILNIPDYFYKLCPAHQADFVRVNVICDYGGIYIDSDTLIIEKLDSLFDILEKKNGFFIKQNNEHLWNGIFGSRKNTPLMIEWKNYMLKLLEIKKENIYWCEIGNDLLEYINYVKSNLYDDYEIFNGLDNLYPFNYNLCVDEFIDKPYDNYKNIIREYQPLLVLVKSVYEKIENMTEIDIITGKMPINYFINKSLKINENTDNLILKYLYILKKNNISISNIEKYNNFIKIL